MQILLYIILFYFCVVKISCSSVYYYSTYQHEITKSEYHFDIHYVTELYNYMKCERWNKPYLIQMYNKTIITNENPDEIDSLSYIYKDDLRKHIVLYISTPIIDKMKDIGDCNITTKINKYIEGCYFYNYYEIFSKYKNDIPIILNRIIEMYPNYKLVFFGQSPLLHLLALEINIKYEIYVDYFYWFHPSIYLNKIGNKVMDKMISDVIGYKYSIFQVEDNDRHLEYTFYKFMNVNIQYNSTYKFCGFYKNNCVEKIYDLNTYCM
jgi:hypothetical protein